MEESENTQNAIDDFKKGSCKNLAQDFDTEVDDLFTKLGELSPSNSSFDSPLLLNRTNKIFTDFKYNVPKTLNRTKTNLIIFESKKNNNKATNTINTIENYNTYKKIDMNKIRYKTEKKNLKKNLKISSVIKSRKNDLNNTFIKNHKKLKSNENIYKILNKTYTDNNIIKNTLPIINETTKIKSKENMKIINENIETINALIKDMKEIDNKIKKKDLKKIINNLLKDINRFNNINDILYESLISLLEFIIELLNSVKIHNNKDNIKIGNEKLILKLQKELKVKDKYLGEIINKAKLEKDKLRLIINTNLKDISELKKENKEINNKLLLYQKQKSKIELEKNIIEEKMNKITIEKQPRLTNSSTTIRNTLENFNNNIEISNMNQTIKSINNNKINDKYNLSKKLNLNLIDLLKEINNIICFYDTFLNKEYKGDKSHKFNKNKNKSNTPSQNNTKNLNNLMDINNLIEENKNKIFHKEFMTNIDIVFKKMEEYIKDIKGLNDKINIINNNDIIHRTKTLNSNSNILQMAKRTKTLGNFIKK